MSLRERRKKSQEEEPAMLPISKPSNHSRSIKSDRMSEVNKFGFHYGTNSRVYSRRGFSNSKKTSKAASFQEIANLIDPNDEFEISNSGNSFINKESNSIASSVASSLQSHYMTNSPEPVVMENLIKPDHYLEDFQPNENTIEGIFCESSWSSELNQEVRSYDRSRSNQAQESLQLGESTQVQRLLYDHGDHGVPEAVARDGNTESEGDELGGVSPDPLYEQRQMSARRFQSQQPPVGVTLPRPYHWTVTPTARTQRRLHHQSVRRSYNNDVVHPSPFGPEYLDLLPPPYRRDPADEPMAGESRSQRAASPTGRPPVSVCLIIATVEAITLLVILGSGCIPLLSREAKTVPTVAQNNVDSAYQQISAQHSHTQKQITVEPLVRTEKEIYGTPAPTTNSPGSLFRRKRIDKELCWSRVFLLLHGYKDTCPTRPHVRSRHTKYTGHTITHWPAPLIHHHPPVTHRVFKREVNENVRTEGVPPDIISSQVVGFACKGPQNCLLEVGDLGFNVIDATGRKIRMLHGNRIGVAVNGKTGVFYVTNSKKIMMFRVFQKEGKTAITEKGALPLLSKDSLQALSFDHSGIAVYPPTGNLAVIDKQTDSLSIHDSDGITLTRFSFKNTAKTRVWYSFIAWGPSRNHLFVSKRSTAKPLAVVMRIQIQPVVKIEWTTALADAWNIEYVRGLLYVAYKGSQKVTVLAPEDGRLVREIPCPGVPRGFIPGKHGEIIIVSYSPFTL